MFMLGQVAAGALSSNPGVAKGIGDVGGRIDMQEIEALLREPKE